MPPQDNFHQIAESGGVETETYHKALKHIQQTCWTEGIDAALKDGDNEEDFDALILFDRRSAGQQIAAQAGERFLLYVPPRLQSSIAFLITSNKLYLLTL